MNLIDSYYSCELSKLTFKSIINSINDEIKIGASTSDLFINFIDGDSPFSYNIPRIVYDLRRSNSIVYCVTLISDIKNCSALIMHFSDIVLDKKVSCPELKIQVVRMLSKRPKEISDKILGNIWGDIIKLSRMEHQVLNLLFEGYNHSQISKILNISAKTVSNYKNKAVKRYGARNFNELFISRTISNT